MDDLRFDSWTRRRFGLATGSLTASMLGLTLIDVPAATKRSRKKKKRCRTFDASCSTGGKKTCCQRLGLACEPSAIDGNRCCKQLGTRCQDGSECCGAGSCDDFGPGSAAVCCNLEGNFCARNADCCEGFTCDEETEQCVELL
jgi:hypothetical protein